MSAHLSPERVIDRLVAQPLFADLDPVSLRVLALAGEMVTLSSNDILFREGDQADGACFILNGFMRLEGRDGSSDHAGASDLLHPLALLAKLQRPYTAVAEEETNVLRIPSAVFMRILDSAPGLALRVRDMLTRDLLRRRKDLKELEEALAQ